MDALLMCGGAGTRLDAGIEKPLLPIGETPMVDRVAAALAASRIETAYAVVSPLAPATREHVDLPAIETPGEGYVADLAVAIEAVELPVLTVAADLPLLTGGLIDGLLDARSTGRGGSLAACVPAALKRRLGASVDDAWSVDDREVAATGLNVVDDEVASDDEIHRGAVHLSYDARLAVNVNRDADAELAEALL